MFGIIDMWAMMVSIRVLEWLTPFLFSQMFQNQCLILPFAPLWEKWENLLFDESSYASSFLDALASLKTMFKINSVTHVFKISRLQSVRGYCSVLQSITECYRVLQSVTIHCVTVCYRVLQSIT